ncbi:MAG TPA: hypothetical protein VF174_09960 [Micromonosporaceae bacterium]
MRDLLVIVPSRSRPHNLPTVVRAWRDTGGFDHAELLFAVDVDDPQLDAYLQAADELGQDGLHVLPGPPARMVPKLNREAVACARRGDWFALGFAGDDHLPRTVGWARRYVDELADLGSGVVYGDDGFQGRNLCTEWAMTADIVRVLGRMVPAPVEHLYSDNAVMDLANAAGCLRWLPDVHIEHMHPLAGRAEWDDQYRRFNSGDQHARDGAAWQCWLANGLAGDVEKVRALRKGVGRG